MQNRRRKLIVVLPFVGATAPAVFHLAVQYFLHEETVLMIALEWVAGLAVIAACSAPFVLDLRRQMRDAEREQR